jgi:hypothetical protein
LYSGLDTVKTLRVSLGERLVTAFLEQRAAFIRFVNVVRERAGLEGEIENTPENFRRYVYAARVERERYVPS